MSPEKDRDRDPSQSDRLPFEPTRRKKPAKASSDAPKQGSQEAVATHKELPAKKSKSPRSMAQADRTIPEVVSKRMVRRMVALSGIPFGLAISTFLASYWIVTQTEISLPHVAVVLVSMGFFGLSVLGLSYGVLSASWDEEFPGSVLGWQEFTTNFGRMTAAWRSTKQNE